MLLHPGHSADVLARTPGLTAGDAGDAHRKRIRLAWNSVHVSGTYGPGSFFGNLTAPGALGDERHTLLGGTVGLGAEYAVTNNISIAGEYRYTAFERRSFNLGAIPFPSDLASQVTASLDKSKSEITGRLNYRFQ